MEQFSVVSGTVALVVEGEVQVVSPSVLPSCPVIGLSEVSESDWLDITVSDEGSLDTLINSIKQSPIAASTLVQLTRYNSTSSVCQALFAESLAYSTLQHGEQFRSWLRASDKREPKRFTGLCIKVEREEELLTLTLNRPENRNAWSTDMRDELFENLQLAYSDSTIERIDLRANGPSFGAGGDLTEFGSARDAAEAHVTRQTRSPAWLLHCLRDHVRAHVHGACVGAGVELPAFASYVCAQPDSFFQLPEVSMGLIPGAGGTASILNRIGKSRFNQMALVGERIPADVALQWGLIDEIQESV